MPTGTLNEALDEQYCALNAVAGAVNTQIVVDGITPLLAGIEVVVMSVLAVQLFQQLWKHLLFDNLLK